MRLEATRLLQMTADGLYDTSTALEEVFLLSSLQAGSRASTTRQLDEEGLDLKDGLTTQLSRVQDVGSLLCSIVVGDEATIERAEVVVAIIFEELLHLPRHIRLAERVGPESERASAKMACVVKTSPTKGSSAGISSLGWR